MLYCAASSLLIINFFFIANTILSVVANLQADKQENVNIQNLNETRKFYFETSYLADRIQWNHNEGYCGGYLSKYLNGNALIFLLLRF